MFINEKEKQLVGLISVGLEVAAMKLTPPGGNIAATKKEILKGAVDFISGNSERTLLAHGEETQSIAEAIIAEFCNVPNQ